MLRLINYFLQVVGFNEQLVYLTEQRAPVIAADILFIERNFEGGNKKIEAESMVPNKNGLFVFVRQAPKKIKSLR